MATDTTINSPATVSTPSFLVDVLATTGRLAKEDIVATMEKLSKNIDGVKVEVYDALKKKYVDFYPNLNTGVELVSRVKNFSHDMMSVEKRIDTEIKNQLAVSAAEFETLSAQLCDTNQILRILEKLVQINDLLQQIDKLLASGEYKSASENIHAVGQLLEHKDLHQTDTPIHMLTAVQTCYQQKKVKLMHDVDEMWSESVRWVLPKEDTSDKKLLTTLQVNTNEEKRSRLVDMLQAMYNVGLLEQKLRVFSKHLLKYVVNPLVTRTNTRVTTDVNADVVSLMMEYPRKESQTSPIPIDVISSLHTLFSFLHTHLLGIAITTTAKSSEEVEAPTKDIPLMFHVGESTAADCLQLLISGCLEHSIPTSSKELDAFSEVAFMVEVFQTCLIEWQFLEEHNSLLTDYVGNINVLFAKKKCQEILEKARSLMTSDIHDTVLLKNSSHVGEIALADFGKSAGDGGKKAKASNSVLKCDTNLSRNTFRMPTCHVSAYVVKLMELAYKTLHEAANSSAPCATQLFYFVRLMFELFCNVVPTYHKEALATLPQMAALHHNDCMYIAHELLTLGHQFQSQLPEALASTAPTFVDLVPKLRHLGTDCFLRCLSKQKQTLLACLASASGFLGVAEEKNFFVAEKAIKQTLHQLQHLGRVWTVLPSTIYSKSLGTLLNSVIADLISCITSLEDISTDDASQLHHLILIIVDRAPSCIQHRSSASQHNYDVATTLCKYVSQWLKLKELMLILTASLQDISDRWADGKGPLSQWFTTNELKQLVRALFQNTDRRAVLLAKLR